MWKRVDFKRLGVVAWVEEAASGDGREGSNDGTVFPGAVSEFDVAADPGCTQRKAYHFGGRDLLGARRGNGDSETCSDEPHNGEPLWGLLNDVGAEAVVFAEGDRFCIGVAACGGGEEDEGIVAKIACGDGFARGERMAGGKDGDKGLGKEDFDLEAFDRAGVSGEAGVESSFDQGLDY
jgi:hypothetical protein